MSKRSDVGGKTTIAAFAFFFFFLCRTRQGVEQTEKKDYESRAEIVCMESVCVCVWSVCLFMECVCACVCVCFAEGRKQQ